LGGNTGRFGLRADTPFVQDHSQPCKKKFPLADDLKYILFYHFNPLSIESLNEMAPFGHFSL